MADFNNDNSLIDTAFRKHIENGDHVRIEDRERWDMPFYVGFYYGNGGLNRTIATACPFDPSFGLVFAGGMPPTITDFTGKTKNSYFGFLSSRVCSSGLSWSSGDIVFSSSGSAVIGGEYMCLNNVGVTYCYVLFR